MTDNVPDNVAVARSAQTVGWVGVGCALASPAVFAVALAVNYGSMWIAVAMLGLPILGIVLGTDSRARAQSVPNGNARPGTAALAISWIVIGGSVLVILGYVIFFAFRA